MRIVVALVVVAIGCSSSGGFDDEGDLALVVAADLARPAPDLGALHDLAQLAGDLEAPLDLLQLGELRQVVDLTPSQPVDLAQPHPPHDLLMCAQPQGACASDANCCVSGGAPGSCWGVHTTDMGWFYEGHCCLPAGYQCTGYATPCCPGLTCTKPIGSTQLKACE